MSPRARSTTPRDRLTVAFISFDFTEYSAAIASALASRSDVSLLVPEDQAPLLGGLNPAVRIVPFHKPRLRQPLAQLRMCRRLIRAIRALEPDVVHLQQGHLWFNFFVPLLRRYPLVVTVHDPTLHPGDRPSQKTPQAVRELAFRRADRLIVHGDALKRAAVEKVGLDPGAVDVVPHVALVNGTPEGKGTAADGSSVLFFGRIWPYKGLEYLIRAEPLVSVEVPDLQIVIAGEGEDFARYRRLMVNPERFVVHNEFVTNDVRGKLFADASVVVLPYVEASQSGVVPLAYAFAKPVVATTVGALPEFVEDGETGYLVPPRDEAALARAITHLLRNPETRVRLGANGRRKLEAECSPERVAEKTLAVYERAISESAGR